MEIKFTLNPMITISSKDMLQGWDDVLMERFWKMVSVINAAQIVKLVSVQRNNAQVVKILNNLANTVVLPVVKDLPDVRHVQ